MQDPDLRVIDCTVGLPNYFDESAACSVEIESGRPEYDKGHIPGSDFVDIVAELTDKSKPHFMFPMPPADQFAAAMSRHGVGDGVRVVLYDRMVNIWAARLWWMLRAFGFDNAAVLNGGWAKWSAEGRPSSTAPASYPKAEFVARSRPEAIADKAEVQQAIGAAGTCLINALDADEFAGRDPIRYGRPGRIPTSGNVSFLEVIDPQTNAYLDADALRQKFEAAGAFAKDRVITYCGGAIAASSDAFLLTLLGKENVAIYDGSLTEWAADPSLPLEHDRA